jgi:dTDP-glucose 4,6-dehydratase
MEVARTVLELLRKPVDLIEHVADRAGHDYRYAIDTSRIRSLGWEPAVGFRQGMEMTVRWFLEHEDWWRPLKSGEYWDYYRRNYRPLEAGIDA